MRLAASLFRARTSPLVPRSGPSCAALVNNRQGSSRLAGVVAVRCASTKNVFRCTNCHRESLRWTGQCSQCKSWNTLIEHEPEAVSTSKEINKAQKERKKWIADESAVTNAADQLAQTSSDRIQIPDPELTRVFGGGLVLGSVVLLAGTPGVGKSTLALQIADMLSQNLSHNRRVLYVSGEESVDQIGVRVRRLKSSEKSFENVDIVNQPNLSKVLSGLHPGCPHGVLIVDSVQTVFLDDLDSDTGGVVQIRGCALACVHLAKSSNIPVILIGHVTKSGDVAGPKTLEHLVDVVLYFDGDSQGASDNRFLYCQKNRFGPTEVGVFHLMDQGFVPVTETPLSFVSSHTNGRIPEGVSWCVTSRGAQSSRFVVAEVQALTNPIFSLPNDPETSASTPSYGPPMGRGRKTKSSGVSMERIDWLTAVIAKHVQGGKILNQSDLFINVIGGLFSNDRGNDLAFAMAMTSSALGRELKWPKLRNRSGIAFVGEIGLTGDIRPAHSMWSRINAANKAGLAQLVVPKRWWDENSKDKRPDLSAMEIIPIDSLTEAVKRCLVDPQGSISMPRSKREK